MIQLNSIKKGYMVNGRKHLILDIPSMSIEQGERISLIGPSGSGKSTLLHVLGGVLTSDAGEIHMLGSRLDAMKEGQRDAFRAMNIGYIFQDFHLIPSLTAVQNIELVIQVPGRRARRDQAEAWLKRVGLFEQRHQRPAELSRGQQQRVAIVRALVQEPRIVLADEPTGSLDWETAQQVMNLLLQLCSETGSTLIAVTHDLHLAQRFPRQVEMREINRVLWHEEHEALWNEAAG